MDLIHKPKHYCFSKFEPKDVIRAWGLNFNLGSAVKYIARAGRKDDIIQDLSKAKEFLTFEIDALKEERGIKDEPEGYRISEVLTMTAKEFLEKFYDPQSGNEADAEHFHFVDDKGGTWILTHMNKMIENLTDKQITYLLELRFEKLRFKGNQYIGTNVFEVTLRD